MYHSKWKKYAIYFLIFCSLAQIKLLPAQIDSSFSFPKQTTEMLRLPSHFNRDSTISLSLSHQQMVNYWIFERRYKIWTEVSKHQTDQELDEFSQQPLIDWNFSSPGLSNFGVEYRESSLYVPVNVQEFNDYKMGRTPYLPIASFALAGFLAQQIYNRYGYLLKAREETRYQGIELSEREIRMLQVLWQENSLQPGEWYSEYFQNYQNDDLTFTVFNADIQKLENKYLLKKRKYDDGTVKYFPAISKKSLIFQLKKELGEVEAQPGSSRPQMLKKMLQYINE
jgi:hypothetical protein